MASGAREATREPWRRDGMEVAAELGTGVDTGLSSTEAAPAWSASGTTSWRSAGGAAMLAYVLGVASSGRLRRRAIRPQIESP